MLGQSRALAPGVSSLLGVVLKEQCWWSCSSCQPSPERGESTKKLTSSKDTGERNGFRFKKLPQGWESGHEGVLLKWRVYCVLVAFGLLTLPSLDIRNLFKRENKFKQKSVNVRTETCW